ncbi:cyanobactin maturation protease PatG family protein [Novipirellula aureliae]|uniref:cyanobactin maturation protease PatG family protein n=1 Tax=Novipirellula aureliae TaxID=2527966 RepID=UPI0018CFC4CF|nr:S8 family serine peptidase [Novipirellula aureliae]
MSECSTESEQEIDNLIDGLADLWKATTGDERVCIAILDGPVDLSHPAFHGANLQKLETIAGGVPDDGLATRHGTHVASIIFGCHDGPVKGVAPRCRGLIVPVFRDVVGRSPVPCSQLDLARAINQAVVAGADIINISGGELSPTGTAHPILADAIRNCDRSGVLIVAAAGNQGCDCLHIPAALPAVLPIGAMDAAGHPLDFSNWGEEYRTRGVLAPGDRIKGAVPGARVGAESGTSYSTPVVSGVVALLMSLHLIRDGTRLGSRRVKDVILDTAINCDQQPTTDCLRLLGGRLNITKAKSIIFPGAQLMADDQPNPDLIHTEADMSSPNVESTTSPDASPTEASSAIRLPIQSAQGGLLPSGSGGGCGCGGGGNGGMRQTPQLVYALGQLGFDFGTEARRDGFAQAMDAPAENVLPNPHDTGQLLSHLEKNPWDAASLIWTLSIDSTAVYAILPAGPYAATAHEQLRNFLRDQASEGVERISVPGIIAGSVRLSSGQVVPAIIPELRGMFSWSTNALVENLAPAPPESGATPAETAKFAERINIIQAGVNNILERVYFELRNLGQTPQDRAINFAATNAFNIETIVEKAVSEKLELDTIEIERSPVCRPESDCWDVKLMFFFPERQVQTVRRAYRFTVDVSDVVPVTVGAVRAWFVR